MQQPFLQDWASTVCRCVLAVLSGHLPPFFARQCSSQTPEPRQLACDDLCGGAGVDCLRSQQRGCGLHPQRAVPQGGVRRVQSHTSSCTFPLTVGLSVGAWKGERPARGMVSQHALTKRVAWAHAAIPQRRVHSSGSYSPEHPASHRYSCLRSLQVLAQPPLQRPCNAPLPAPCPGGRAAGPGPQLHVPPAAGRGQRGRGQGGAGVAGPGACRRTRKSAETGDRVGDQEPALG